MFKTLFKPFRRPTPKEVAARELAEAELSLMSHLKAQAYSKALAAYNVEEIKRLRAQLAKDKS